MPRAACGEHHNGTALWQKTGWEEDPVFLC